MTGRQGDGGDTPRDIDAAFAQIVADLEREGVGRSLPADEPPRPDPAPEPDPPPDAPPRPTEAAWRGNTAEYDVFNDNEDEGYDPPEPPPLPRLRWPTMLAIGLVGAGILLLLLPAIASVDGRFVTPLGLVTLAAGICTLLLRTRTTSRLDPGDDGAEV